MTFTWHPRNLLVAIVLSGAFAIALNVALDFRTGTAVGGLAFLVYLVVDVLLTLNPARWNHARRQHREQQ